MLTPVDVQNKVFKGGIGYDKKDVETFMKELSSDYEQLYRSSVELKDKVTTLTESLQHYRSTEESMQKALTLSEKTAEETIIAAKDKARQIKNEATKKAEALLADAKQELLETKDEIYRLQQLHAKFKAQYTKILQGQLQLIENKVVDIDLGEGYDIGNFEDYGLGGSGLGGGLGSLGEGGGYTGASSFDDRFERTNQEPAFNRGSLNTDPFADAANGGGRFSRHTGKGFTGNSSKRNTSSSTENKSTLNVKNTNTGSTKVKRNFTATSQAAAEKAVADKASAEKSVATEAVTASSASQKPQTDATNQESNAASTQKVPQTDTNPVSATQQAATDAELDSKTIKNSETPNKENSTPVNAVVSDSEPQPAKVDLSKDSAISGDVENKVNESTLISNDDDNDEGFSFMEAEVSNHSHGTEEGIVSGEVEEKIEESSLIGNDDDEDEGFNFMDNTLEKTADHSSEALHFSTDFSSEESLFFEEDSNAISGEVEERIDEATMLESEDNNDEGFNFVSDEEDNHDEDFSFANNEEDIDSDISVDATFESFDDEEDAAYAGEVEDKVNEATMLESEDDYDEGFDFVVGNDKDMEEEIPTISSGLNIDFDLFTSKSEPENAEPENDNILVGDVEEPVNQSNLIGDSDDDSDGFDFV